MLYSRKRGNIIEIRNESLQASAYDGEKLIGKCQYRINGDNWVIYHTDVDKEYGGQGIALRLLQAIVVKAKEEGKRIKPECSYVRHVFEKDRDRYRDVIAH